MRRKNPKFDNQEERRSPEDDNRNSADRRGSRQGNNRNSKRNSGRSHSSDNRRSSSHRDNDNSQSSRGSFKGRDGKKSFGNKRGGVDKRQEERGAKNESYSRDSRNNDDKRSYNKRDKNDEKPNERRGFKKREGDKFSKNEKPRNEKRGFGRKSSTHRSDSKGEKDARRSNRREFGDKRERGATREGSDRNAPRRKFGQDKREIDRAKIGRKFRPRTKANEPVAADDGLIRLNKYIANSGICSRRQADEYIRTGLVEVNGTVITEMGFKVKPEDDVRFDGGRITPEKKTYVLLNKPKGYITTTNDEHDRKTVMDLVGNATNTRLFPVGRLDRQTTGVLLFTNDGYLSKKLTHPSHNITKIYHVVLDKDLHGDDMEKIRQGIHMHEGLAKVDKVSFIDGKPHNEVGVEIHIGWNRVVRRIFEKLGYKVEALDRVQFAGLTKKNVKRGQWRILDQKEVNFLKML